MKKLIDKNRIYGLDGLRFVAAISVVLFHYISYSVDKDFALILQQSNFGWLVSISKYGFLGVELFFMISGFVILYSAQNKSWQDFTKSRFIRIYPTLWLAATITFFGVLLLGSTSKDPTVTQYLANLTLMHRFVFNQPHLDGVYWTLTTELRFYLIIGVMLAFGWLTEKKLKSVMVIWSVLAITYLSLGKAGNFITYGAYFSAGVGFYYYWAEDKTFYNKLYLLFTLIASIYSGIIAHSDLNLSNNIIGLVITAYFGCFYFLLNGYQLPISNKVLVSLGGITYPLYLLHQELGYSLLQYVEKSANTYIAFSFITTMLMIFLAFIIYRYFEPRAHAITSKYCVDLIKKYEKK